MEDIREQCKEMGIEVPEKKPTTTPCGTTVGGKTAIILPSGNVTIEDCAKQCFTLLRDRQRVFRQGAQMIVVLYQDVDFKPILYAPQ